MYILWSSLCSFLSSLPSLHPFSPNIVLSPCSQTPLIRVFLLMWGTKFRAHTKRVKVIILYILIFMFSYWSGRQNILNCQLASLPWISLLVI
jgi:hypothetical protein